ncbi:protein DA1 [Nocardioides alpinus]|uniref:IrrE N-terminal-like domain-containing protein n=1 Tax=Nocardioides alpinus TaxID=748909 RepID=A0ABX4QWA8_9ACTN|nr:protein DA1 [Nocardioides alpinus]PKH40152.1 hypothetical protein CXG46_13420 [Nocardioides alpinus]
MAQIGLNVPLPVVIDLVPTDYLSAAFAVDSSQEIMHLGLTRFEQTTDGRVFGPIQIAVLHGLPSTMFRRTLAHEYGHALLAGAPAATQIPLHVVEGFAEALAETYLVELGGNDAVGRWQRSRLGRGGHPTYDQGFQLISPIVRSHGARHVAAALRRGPGGLSAIGL